MNKKTLKDLENLEGKVVILRADLNVPINNGEIQDFNRINATLPTLKHLIEAGSKVLVMSHLGRVASEEDKTKNTLAPVAKKLGELINQEVNFIPVFKGNQLEEAVNNLTNGQVIMMENTRHADFVDGELVKLESKNDSELGKYWASLADIFVNDAFGTSHRKHASNVGIASNIEVSAIGYLIEKEVEYLHKSIENGERPMVSLLGGAKVSDKINVIEALAEKSDKVIIGTAMCYTFHLAMGKNVGNSLSEKDQIPLAKELMAKYEDKLVIAEDSVAAPEFKDVEGIIVDEVPDGMIGMDVGPKTLEKIKEVLSTAKTVIWNGPFGVSEMENFKHGSETIAQLLVDIYENGGTTIIGGGDSAAMAIKMGLQDKFTHISTGGGASMEFLEGKILPGIEAIQDK